MGRTLLLVSAFSVLALGEATVLLLAPGRLALYALPVLGWGGLFMVWAWKKLKDPQYYG
ncbi:MAG: hypothetical protein ACYTFG_03860 [Planctomycetota bacterium]|jgi:hypothetical protein